MKKILPTTLIVSALLSSTSALAGIIADGNHSDWSINTGNLSSSDASVRYVTEDQHDSYLDPGYGGQRYDAEGIYTRWDNNALHIGVLTGRAQNASGWSAGDIAIDLGSNGNYEFGVVTSNKAGSGSGIGNPGELYAVSQWNYGIWEGSNQYVGLNAASAVAYAHPTSVAAGTLLGNTSFAYSGAQSGLGTWVNDDHYFIETSIDLSMLGGQDALLDDGFSLHWTANCNNDFITIDVAAVNVPEPASTALIALGLLALAAARLQGREQA